MSKKALTVFIAAGVVMVAVLTGLIVLLANVLGGRPSSRTGVWDDDETETETETERSIEETEIPTTTTRETQGRDYYENGGYKAMAVYNGFIDRYSSGAIGTEDYDMMGTFDRGVRIKLSDFESKLVAYKRVRDKYDNYYWLIYVSEDY